MKDTLQRLPLVGAALFWLSGCDDPLLPVERVDGLRVLGARVEVENEPERAAPAPGESVKVRWLVASPDGTPRVGFALAACAAEEKTFGSASCSGEPFAAAVSPLPTLSPPELSLTIPNDLDPDVSRKIAVLGSVCEDALPLGTPATSACPDGTPGTKVSLAFELAHPGDVNTNPSFAEPALELDDMPWLPASSAPADCMGGDAPSVIAGSGVHRVRVKLADDARDALPKQHALDPEKESLLVSHFSSAGELERAFTSAATDDSLEVPWTAPRSAAPAGERVRFWFVVRDLRGGSAFTERILCLLP